MLLKRHFSDTKPRATDPPPVSCKTKEIVVTDSTSRFVGNIPEHYDSRLGPVIFADCAEDLARRVAATGATRVLEIAAGTGIASRKLRDALAPGARLVITDLNPPMLAIAQTKFRQGEAVELQQADAMALPFAAGTFDVVACQFGVMFFPDRVASFREVARVLQPGGRYIFSTWGSMAANPYAQVNYDVISGLMTDSPPQFGKVPFSCHDADRVRDELGQAGWDEVQHDRVVLNKVVTDVPGFARGVVFGTPLFDEITRHGTVAPTAVVAAIARALSLRFGPDPVVFPLQANVFTCRIAG